MRLAAACLLGFLAACNALTGVGDLAATACDACEGGVGGGGLDGGSDAVIGESDGALLDAPVADTSMEGPGGTLDPTFGTGGIVESDLLPDPRAVAVRADGRIVIAGAFSNDLAAVAFTSTGAVDTIFGGNGRVLNGLGNSSAGHAIAFDAAGRALVGGVSVVASGTGVTTRYAYVVRIGPVQVDPTFGDDGSWRGAQGQEVRGLVTTSTGGIVLSTSDKTDHVFWRLTAAGAPDPTFGKDGTVSVSVGDEPGGLVARADGFVSGGSGRMLANERAFGAAKVSLGGIVVSGFGVAGKAAAKVGTKNDAIGRAIGAQQDGKVVVVGDYDPDMNVANTRRVSTALRFTTAGQLDTAYGASGYAVIDLSEVAVVRETETSTVGVAVDSRSRALVVGTVADRLVVGGAGQRSRAWVVRLRADGSFDPLFGAKGKLFISPTGRLEARGAALQADGKLVVVGVNQDTNKLFVARIITSTTL
jgi:uncharacterized delta-60 repeat protein